MNYFKWEQLRQVEYYFGDSNLLWDMQLNALMDRYGWISIEALTKLPKLKLYFKSKPSKTSFLDFVGTHPSELIELNADKSKIRRRLNKKINVEVLKNELIAKSIYVIGLSKDLTSRQISEYFSSFGSVVDVWMFRKPPVEGFPDFLGKAYIQFTTEDEAQHLIRRQEINYLGNKIRILNRKYYNRTIQDKPMRLYKIKSEDDATSLPVQKKAAPFYMPRNTNQVDQVNVESLAYRSKALKRPLKLEEKITELMANKSKKQTMEDDVASYSRRSLLIRCAMNPCSCTCAATTSLPAQEEAVPLNMQRNTKLAVQVNVEFLAYRSKAFKRPLKLEVKIAELMANESKKQKMEDDVASH